jgi:hypothetical protein
LNIFFFVHDFLSSFYLGRFYLRYASVIAFLSKPGCHSGFEPLVNAL